MWWIGSCPQHLTWIQDAFSKKPELTHDGWTDGRLCHDSSSADKVK